MTRQAFRLARGGRIDRSERLRFRFDGRELEGHPGDSLASALIANGVHHVGRSFKYHRPRGILGSGAEEPNALVQLENGPGHSDPNMRATQVELYDGLNALSQNRWPSLEFDIGAVNNLVSPLLPSGFYYKTFMWPASWWKKVYEPRIRAAAGLGHAPDKPDPDRYLQRHAHCDLLVVGAGPAGLAAALAAGRAGARVILADEQAESGGSLLAESGFEAAETWRRAAMAELDGMAEVTLLPRTTVTGYYDHNYLVMLERVRDHLPPGRDAERPRQRFWRVRARHVVIATGAIERPLVFDGNDRPGVMLASAGRSYLNRHAALVGRRIVFFTNNDSAYAAALDLARAGAEIACIADVRHRPDGALVHAAIQAGLRVRPGHVVAAAEGGRRVREASIAEIDAQGRLVGHLGQPVRCDSLLVSGGWNPNVALFAQSRGRLAFDDDLAAFVPGDPEQATEAAGAAAGRFGIEAAMRDGIDAAGRALAALGLDPGAEVEVPRLNEPASDPLAPVWRVPPDRPSAWSKAFVDYQNDVTAKDLGLAIQEGYRSVEHVKRYTTTGMGTDQGRIGNVNALGIVAGQLGAAIPELGVTTFRPPYTPLTFAALAGHSRGELFDVVRRTPIHGWAEAHGAVFEEVGNWKRAHYFPQPGEGLHEAVQREAKAVRTSCGMLDATTLGKIDIQGPDAREFLNRVYTNAWSKLAPGRCRYGLMLRDDGMVFDDGVTACIKDDHFHMTTTTGGAPRVLHWLEELLQTEWPDLRVFCTSVTEQWATMALNGPNARRVLEPLIEDADISAESFRHMAWQEATIAGVRGRIFRISFTGELSFEVNVPAGYGRYVWEAIVGCGRAHGLTVYGTETMHLLRAEKGLIIVGQETDGTVTPYDLGMDWIVSNKKKDFIGKRGLARTDLQKPDRKQLVGLLTTDPQTVLEEGAHVLEDTKDEVPKPMLGHVTSSYMSPNLGRSIALAVVQGGRERKGQKLFVSELGGRPPVEVEVVSSVFLDPDGARLHG